MAYNSRMRDKREPIVDPDGGWWRLVMLVLMLVVGHYVTMGIFTQVHKVFQTTPTVTVLRPVPVDGELALTRQSQPALIRGRK